MYMYDTLFPFVTLKQRPRLLRIRMHVVGACEKYLVVYHVGGTARQQQWVAAGCALCIFLHLQITCRSSECL